MDYVVVLLCIVGFAWWMTMHVFVALGLASRRPRWRAVVGFLLVPLGPYWAWREHMRRRVWLWGAGLCVYAIALGLAMR
jgi:hypothetical protein